MVVQTATAAKSIFIRPAVENDAPAVAEIYNHYILQTTITFEEDAVSPAEMRRRMSQVRSQSLPWLAAENEDKLVGYAYADKWKARSAYRHTVEVTVYIAPDFAGRGIGSQLYGQLITALKAQNIHAAIGAIALPNPASVALHEKLGFTRTGHLKEVGFKFNQWIDVGYWQLVL